MQNASFFQQNIQYANIMPFYNPYYPYYCPNMVDLNVERIYDPNVWVFPPNNQSNNQNLHQKLMFHPNLSNNEHNPSELSTQIPYPRSQQKMLKGPILFKRKGKRQLIGSIEEKQNRNVTSNILRSFFKKINDPSKIQRTVQSIIMKYNLKLTVEQFLSYIKGLNINHGKYLRFNKLRLIFVNKHLVEHSMILRILFEHFTQRDMLTQTLTSRKINRWSIILHLRGMRRIKQRLNS